MKYEDFVVQVLFLVFTTSRSLSGKVRQTVIGKEYGFTSQVLVNFVH